LFVKYKNLIDRIRSESYREELFDCKTFKMNYVFLTFLPNCVKKQIRVTFFLKHIIKHINKLRQLKIKTNVKKMAFDRGIQLLEYLRRRIAF
jgi:hypothetical protein